MQKQRTTITLEGKLLRKAKHEAVERGISFGDLITIALTQTLNLKNSTYKSKLDYHSSYVRDNIQPSIVYGAHHKTMRSQRQQRLNAAKAFVGSINPKVHPEWSDEKKVLNWQKKIRSEN